MTTTPPMSRPAMVHRLKTHPEPFAQVSAGFKKHEVRTADRDFRRGDTVILEEWDPNTQHYTGFGLRFIIGHVTPPGAWGLPPTHCVFSLMEPEGASALMFSPKRGALAEKEPTP